MRARACGPALITKVGCFIVAAYLAVSSDKVKLYLTLLKAECRTYTTKATSAPRYLPQSAECRESAPPSPLPRTAKYPELLSRPRRYPSRRHKPFPLAKTPGHSLTAQN